MKVFIFKKVWGNALKSILLSLLLSVVGMTNAQNTETRYGQWYYYDNGEYLGYYDHNETGIYRWGVMFPAGSYTGDAITKISIFDCSPTNNFQIRIYNDGETEPVGDYTTHAAYNPMGSNILTGSMSFVEIAFNTPRLIDASKNVWVIVNESYPHVVDIPYCTINDNPNSSWIYYGNEWGSFESLTGQAGHNFMLRAYFEETSINFIEEVHLNDFTTPAWGEHPDFDLTVPTGAHYAVDAVSWYGGGILNPNSVFTNENYDYDMSVFLTPEEGYGFSPSTEVYFDGDASIVGSIRVESDGRLRVNTISFHVTKPSGNLSYGFEDGTLQGWTTIDADGDGFNWELTTSGVHGGSHAVMSESWDVNAGALTPDNYLVSPVKLQYSQISFWAAGIHPSWSAEHFGVAVSTAGNSNPSDFTTIAEWTATSEFTEYTADLSAYNGRDIWVAIRHFGCTDQYALNVDDITLTVNDAPAGIPITEIYVNGFTAPTWGSHPDFDVVLSADAHCAVTNVIWVHDEATMEPNEVFDDEDNRYFMRLEFLAEDGYTFDPEATVYFNGDASIHDAGWNYLFENGLLWAFTIDFYLTAPAPGTCVLTVLCDPTMGTVTGSGTYAEGSSVTIEAIPLDGYIFDHWNDNSTENPRTVIIESNKTFEAFFKQNGVNEYGLNALSVYPNPANETIRINGLETDATIEIYNSLGAKVKTMNVTADGEINIGDMAPGIYMLRCGQQALRFVKE